MSIEFAAGENYNQKCFSLSWRLIFICRAILFAFSILLRHMQISCNSVRTKIVTLQFLTAFLCVAIGVALRPSTCIAKTTDIEIQLDEQVVMAPVYFGKLSGQLETTIFKPPGPGPFPLLIMNGGKGLGNPHTQKRDRFIALSSEFVERGYAVVIPMRKGYSKSTGEYVGYGCDFMADGQAQADDLQSALEYFVMQNWVDKKRILIAGQSYGGLATMAFGTRHFPGVRGLINFAGGLRAFGGNCEWQASLVTAFAHYGAKAKVPSLWFYGENDSHFDHALATKMHSAYIETGNKAILVAFGPFENDAHKMSSSWDGVNIWWPETEKFLRHIGLPTQKIISLSAESKIMNPDFSTVSNITSKALFFDDGCNAAKTVSLCVKNRDVAGE